VIFVQFLLIFLLVYHPPLTYGDYVYPTWANVFCAVMSLFVIIWVPVFAVYGFCTQSGDVLQVSVFPGTSYLLT